MGVTKLSNLRQTLTDFARSYKYIFILTPKVGATSLAAILDSATQDKLKFSCVNTNMPSKGVQEITVEVGTYTMREPGRKELGGTITPEFIMGADWSIYNFFESWNRMATSDSGVNGFHPSYAATLTIKQLDGRDNIRMVKTYDDAWCRLCPEIQSSDDSNDIIRFQPEIVYETDVTDVKAVAEASGFAT